MEFVNYDQPDDAAAAIQTFMRSEESKKLPEDAQEKIWEMLRPGASISFAVAHFAEMIYARLDKIKSKEALQLAASCAAYGSFHSVDNLGNGRGASMMQALRRESGEKLPVGLSWPKNEDDPEPREGFLVKPKEVQPPANA